MSIEEASLDKALFKSNPNLFIANVIKEYLAHSPINRLHTFDDAPMWGEPLVGFADGDDPIFQLFKTIVGKFHMTPREALGKYVEAKRWNYSLKKEYPVSVISYILPIPLASLEAERTSPYGGTLRANNNRWMGEVVWRIWSTPWRPYSKPLGIMPLPRAAPPTSRSSQTCLTEGGGPTGPNAILRTLPAWEPSG